MKFIERQKLTRLEKSVSRQLNELQGSNSEEQTAALQRQLQSIAMDQLYIAFYPSNVKYMALFTNGNERVVDDERGKKRRRDVWNQIRRGLLSDLKADGSSAADVAEEKRLRLDSKKWVNFEAAKAALLSMPEDTYPNADVVSTGGPATVKTSKSKRQKSTKKSDKVDTKAGKQESKASGDSRFALSKELDGMFAESTTGNDFQEKLGDNSNSSSASSSEDDSSSEDEADPLKDFDGNNHAINANRASAATENNSSSSSASSSSSSDSDSDSDSSSDSSDEEPSKGSIMAKDDVAIRDVADDDGDDDSEDDFFASSTALSATDAFARAQADQEKNRRRNGRDESMSYGRGGRPDKSAGFKSQNQSRREYRAYQQRSKRQKFG